MLSSGPVSYEIGANVDATCFGGIAAVHRLVTKLGLVEQINQGLHLLKVHLPYHESDHVLNLAYNVVCGGTRLEDIERLRHDSAYLNALGADLIPDPTTAGDFCRRFAEADVVELMERINAVRPQLWTGQGRELLGPVAYIDADGTIAPTDGQRKQGMDLSYKGVWGYAPLIVSLANTREVLYLVNRPGNAPSHQGAAAWIDKAIDLVAPHAPRVCLRGDTDFSLTAHFDRWAKKVDFIFGMDASPALRRGPRPSTNDAGGGCTGRPRTSPAPARPGRGDPTTSSASSPNAATSTCNWTTRTSRSSSTFPASAPAPTGSSWYVRTSAAAAARTCCSTRSATFFYITTRTDLTAAQIVELANERCDQENVIGQLKSGINALRVPLYDLVSNWAHMVIAALAWNLKAWFAMMMHRKADRHEYIRMEFRRFLNSVILIPAMVMRRARGITVRLIGYTPSLDRLFSAWTTIERTRFG